MDEIPGAVGIDPEVVSFLNNRSHTAVRAWANPQTGLTAAVSVTEYPYDVFAAAALAATIDDAETEARTFSGTEDIADVHTFLGTGREGGTGGSGPAPREVQRDRAGAGRCRRAAGSRGRRGRPDPPTRRRASRRGQRSVPVPVAAVHLRRPGRDVRRRHRGGAGIGRRGSRPRWTLRRSDDPPVVVVASPPPAGVVSLDAGASDLRRRGIVVVAAQLIALNVIVISLAGDFAWRGVAVAVLGLAGGLGFTSWWRRKELGALGPKGSGTPFILPRPAGALVGIISLAVLGVGVSYALKGIRYLLLKPSLAQLRWSNLLGLSPRGVGVAFAIGGLIVAIIGGILFRVARARPGGHPTASRRRPPAAGAVPALVRGRQGAAGHHRLRAAALLRAVLVPGAGPVRGGGRLGVRHLRTRRRGGPAGSVPGLAGRGREHLSDDTWQEQVAMRMHDACGRRRHRETPGLRWEVSQVVAGGHLDKAVFVFPPLEGGTLARRWEFTSTALAAAGAPVGPLPADPVLIHTAQVAADGVVTATIATATKRPTAPRSTADGAPALLSATEIRCGEARQLRGQVGAGPVLLTLHGAVR